MPEDREEGAAIRLKGLEQSSPLNGSAASIVEPSAKPSSEDEHVTQVSRVETQMPSVAETPLPLVAPSVVYNKRVVSSTLQRVSTRIQVHVREVYNKRVVSSTLQPIKERDRAVIRFLRERCRQLSLSTFFREIAPVRSLGLTSSIGGEGKSFLAILLAGVLANDSSNPVILLECNWNHPSLHEYYSLPAVPGLAEWLRGECSETDIRHQVDYNLTVIPAGDGEQDAVKLLQQIRQRGLLQMFARSNELLLVDLPPVMTTGYGPIAASLVEELMLVVRAGVTPDALVQEACEELKDLPIQGVILNQLESQIPHWIRAFL